MIGLIVIVNNVGSDRWGLTIDLKRSDRDGPLSRLSQYIGIVNRIDNRLK